MRATENAILVGFVVWVTYTDWRWRRIPNGVTYPAMLAGLILGALEALPGEVFVRGFADHVAGLIVAFAVSYPFYAGGGLKAGDGKLLMAVGALRGLNFLLFAAVYGAIIGGVIAVGFIVARRFARPVAGAPPNTLSRVLKTWIPYGVALGLGALLALGLESAGLIRVTNA